MKYIGGPWQTAQDRRAAADERLNLMKKYIRLRAGLVHAIDQRAINYEQIIPGLELDICLCNCPQWQRRLADTVQTKVD